MGKIVLNGNEYGNNSVPALVYVAERVSTDGNGHVLTEDFLTAAEGFSCHEITELPEMPNAGFHNSFYRGKDITSKLTDGSFWTAISSGTFEDLFVGDWFMKNNHKYVVAGFNIYYNNGDTAFTSPHAVCVPDISDSSCADVFKNKKMKETNTTEGGYVGCLEGQVFTDIKTFLETEFEDHLAEHRELLSSQMKANVPNGPYPIGIGSASKWAWNFVKFSLMTEIEILGTTLLASSGYDIGTGKVQLPLFKFSKSILTVTNGVYTRCVADSGHFVGILNHTESTYNRGNMDMLVKFCLV